MAQSEKQRHHFFRAQLSVPRASRRTFSFWNVAVITFLSLAIASFLLGGLLFYQFALVDDMVVIDNAARALSGSVNKNKLEKVIQTLDGKEALFETYLKEKPDFSNPSP